MTRTVAVLLGAGVVVLVIGIVLLIKIINGNGPSPPPKTRRVEIISNKGTQIFAKLPGDSEQHLGDLAETPLMVDVRSDATIVLRYKGQEKIFPPEKWKGIKLTEDFGDAGKRPSPSPPGPSPIVTVSINAVPWAKVFIKLPGTDRFIKPPEKKSNITPIRGGLNVLIDTEIKLEYGGREKTFSYDEWKTSKLISHDFLNP